MKKLMIAAAVAALTAGAFADACTDDPETPDCVTAFTVKFSGKTATQYETKKAEYKTVQKISGKGALAIDADYVTETLAVKVGKVSYGVVLEDGTVTKFTYFGKNLATVTDENKYKPGKTYSLEADLGVTFEDADDYSINVNQVAFGKVKVYITKDKVVKGGACGEDEVVEGCTPVVTPVSFSGWFTGDFVPTCIDEAEYDDLCYAFDGSDIALIGGTWSAKYDKKNSTVVKAE